MRLREALRSILNKIRSATTEEKTRKIIMLIMVVAAFLLIIISALVKNIRKGSDDQNSDVIDMSIEAEEDTQIENENDITEKYKQNEETIKNQYAEYVDKYNQKVDEYNDLLEKVGELFAGLTERKFEVDIIEMIPKEKIGNYEQSEIDENSIAILESDISEIEADVVGLETEYETCCSNAYKSTLELYEEKLERYNGVLEDIAELDILSEEYSAEETEYNGEIKEEQRNKWRDSKLFFDDIDIIAEKSDNLDASTDKLLLESYNLVSGDYNVVADEYNKCVTVTSIDFLEGLPKEIKQKSLYSEEDVARYRDDVMVYKIKQIMKDTDDVVSKYLVVKQITAPGERWVTNRLQEIPEIRSVGSVREGNDPNGLLGKEGGYSACIYFTDRDIDISTVPGDGVVGKGTDAGGAIEIYDSVEYALNRCDYLSQFDNTLLYSGSYAIVGTMVIRTSYKLTNEQQVELTNNIVMKLTEIK